MSMLIKKLWVGYQFLFDECSDERTKSWLLVAKPYQILMIVFVYLMFVLKWGPQWMKNRTAYNLKSVLIVYNTFQIVACAYIFISSIRYAWGWHYKWVCEPVDLSNSTHAMIVAKFVYYYYLMKILDLMDTVFFVLRKKNKQVSFLHVYHHSGMALLLWGGVTYLPGGHGTLIGVINSFVHVVMYGYYLLTVAYPKVKESIWWKKHITQLQIVQFFLCVVHMANIVFRSDCAYPRWTAAVFLPQNLFMLVLFMDFYIKTYIKKPAKALNGFSQNGLHNVCHTNGVKGNKKIKGN